MNFWSALNFIINVSLLIPFTYAMSCKMKMVQWMYLVSTANKMKWNFSF